MKKIFCLMFILLICFLGNRVQAYASNSSRQQPDPNAMINQQFDVLDFSEIDRVINDLNQSAHTNISLQDLALKAVQGQLDLSPKAILMGLGEMFVIELKSLISLIRNMLIVSILSALLKNLSVSFTQKSVSELSFYVSYIVIIMILMSSFTICVNIMSSLVSGICTLMAASLPLMLTFMALTGKVTSSYMFSSLILFFINLISNIVKNYLTPVIIFAAVLQLINYISEKDLLLRLSELIKKAVSWCLKGTITLFMAILSLQSISAPILNNVVTKSAKAALNVVPVVGEALSGAIDTVMHWSGAAKSGFMIALLIVVVITVSVPILKLFVFMLVFRFTAAFMQPISDPRIIKAIDSVGSFTSLLLSSCVLVSFMFVFMIIILLGVI